MSMAATVPLNASTFTLSRDGGQVMCMAVYYEAR